MQQRRHAADQRSSCCAGAREAQTGGCAAFAKQVARGTTEKQKPRPLAEVVHELQDKVIKAAQQLQVKLSSSAEQPAASTVGQPGAINTADSVDFDDPPWLTELKVRQRKRAQAEDQQPHAKPKAAKRQKRGTASTTFDGDEQPASKRQQRCLTQAFFAESALDFSEYGAASSGSAAQLAPVQQQRRYMGRLLHTT